MLEGLDDIDWASLDHAYGSAEAVPRWLRALGSRIVWRAERAEDRLRENLIHQGGIRSATPHVIPFLLELLDADVAVGPFRLLSLLDDLSEWVLFADARESESVEWRAPIDDPDDDDPAAQWSRDTEAAISAGLPTLARFRSSDDRDIRGFCARLFAFCGSSAASAHSEIVAWFAEEPDSHVRADLIVGRARLSRYGSTDPVARVQVGKWLATLGDEETLEPALRFVAIWSRSIHQLGEVDARQFEVATRTAARARSFLGRTSAVGVAEDCYLSYRLAGLDPGTELEALRPSAGSDA